MSFAGLRKVLTFALIVPTVSFTPVSHALEGTWYIGIGAGITLLEPDTDGSNFTLEDDAGQASYFYLGRDFNDWLSVEFAYTDLGEATLSGNETIGYTAMSLGGVAYIFGQRDVYSRQQGLSGYFRFGVNLIENDATIELDSADNTAAWLGIGAQWPLGEQWGIRAEATSYDGDAQAVLASLYWRLKPDESSARRQRTRVGQTPIARPPEPTFERPEPPPVLTQPRTNEADRKPAVTFPNLQDSADCGVAAPNEPRDERGCALFSGILEGVEFVANTTQLTTASDLPLNRLANSLAQHPRLVIEIQTHTDSSTDPDTAMNLTRQRVLTLAKALASKGVDVKRLRARAFGDTQPRAENNTTVGRQLNNRVVLQVLR